MYIDTHAHFDLCINDTGITENELLNALKENKINEVVQISTDSAGLEWSRDFALRNKAHGIYFALGLHPSAELNTAEELKNALDHLERITSTSLTGDIASQFLGLGELGLDYYYEGYRKEIQMELFSGQLEIARKYDLPIFIHTRDAMRDTLDLLKELNMNKGIFHCFSGDVAAAREVLDLGFYVSFAGNVTFKKAVDLQESARYIPMDRLLLETDCPYLSPVPLRGKPNRPHHVIHTYDYVAGLKNITVADLALEIQNNFKCLKKMRNIVD